MRVPPPNPVMGGTARPKNPGQIATGLQGWWRGDSGVCSDTGGTTPSVNGGAVARWNDLSGNGNNALQATGANQPTYKTSALNSLPGIRTQPSQFLATAAVAAMAGTKLTMMIVIEAPSDRGVTHQVASVITSSAPAPQSVLSVLFIATGGGSIRYNARNSAGTAVPMEVLAGSGGDVVIERWDQNGTTALNVGATRSATTTGADHANTGNTNVTPVGRQDGTSPTNDIVIMETAVWSRYLTDLEAKQLTAYAKARYGL